MPRPETRASVSSAGTLLSTVMLLAIIVTTTWLRTGVAHDIVRPLSNQGLRMNVETQICLKWQVLRHQKRC